MLQPFHCVLYIFPDCLLYYFIIYFIVYFNIILFVSLSLSLVSIHAVFLFLLCTEHWNKNNFPPGLIKYSDSVNPSISRLFQSAFSLCLLSARPEFASSYTFYFFQQHYLCYVHLLSVSFKVSCVGRCSCWELYIWQNICFLAVIWGFIAEIRITCDRNSSISSGKRSNGFGFRARSIFQHPI